MTTMQQMAAAQASPEVIINENFETLEHQAVYGKRPETTTGLTWGYIGGRWGGFSVVADTLTLAGSATNYIVVEVATGDITVSSSATDWNNTTDFVRVYKLTTSGAAVTAVEDHRAGPGGVHGGTGTGGGGGGGGGGGTGTKTYSKFSPLSNQPPASNFATLDTRNSIAVLDFDDATQEAAVFVDVMPEGADLTSGLVVKIHFAATSATSGDVVWGAQFERMTTDMDSDSFDTATEVTQATNGTSGILTVASITCTDVDSVTQGNAYRLKVYRKAADGADTMSGDAEVVMVEVRSAA